MTPPTGCIGRRGRKPIKDKQTTAGSIHDNLREIVRSLAPTGTDEGCIEKTVELLESVMRKIIWEVISQRNLEVRNMVEGGIELLEAIKAEQQVIRREDPNPVPSRSVLKRLAVQKPGSRAYPGYLDEKLKGEGEGDGK